MAITIVELNGAALREGDYSFRVHRASRKDAFDEVVAELNLLAENLRKQRVEDLEATALVRKVMAEIDVAVFAFDASDRLRQVNTAGEDLFGDEVPLLGASASELGLDGCLTGLPARTVQLEISIHDEGPGLPESANLFVPFFTTKAEGSGIGLFLCRHIAEAHGGSVTVRNHKNRPGCEATLRIPITEG